MGFNSLRSHARQEDTLPILPQNPLAHHHKIPDTTSPMEAISLRSLCDSHNQTTRTLKEQTWIEA